MSVRLHILSDLHVEFEDVPAAHPQADVVVLAGDIGVGAAGLAYAKRQFPDVPVVYVAGNHEYYHHALPMLTDALRSAAAPVHFLENASAVIHGVRFLGCTLWTDLCLLGRDYLPIVVERARRTMNDFRLIETEADSAHFHPLDALKLHETSRAWLHEQLAIPFDGPTVVVTHHAPSRRSIAPGYANDLLSAAFASDLEPLIVQYQPSLWVHGHTHWCVDYCIGGTRILSNQRGYPHAIVLGYQPDLTVEIGRSQRF